MASIRQNVYPDVLPDFRNLGVIARILVGVNVLALAAAVYAAPAWTQALATFVGGAAFLEPLLLVSLVVLYASAPALARLPYWWGCAAVLGLVSIVAAGAHLGKRVLYRLRRLGRRTLHALPGVGRS